MDGSIPDPTHPPSRQQAAVGGSGASSKALQTHPLPNQWNQVSMHRTLIPLLGPPRPRSLRSTSLPYRGYVGGPTGPTCTVSGCRGAAQPPRWLWWTIWLDYAIRFARRPPKFRGIHLTAVKAADDHVLWGNCSQLGIARYISTRSCPKSKLSPMQRIFSRYGVGFGQSDSAPHAETCSVGVELLEYVQEQDGGTTETVSEAPRAYGSCGGSHAAGGAPYETASTLAPWPSPEVGMAVQHAPGPSHSGLLPNLHPVVRPLISSGRSAPGTGLQAGCGLHGCLRQGLGGHVQRACRSGVWTCPQLHRHIKVQGFFICHIINYTGYNQKWNVIKSGPLSGQCKRIKNKNYIKVTQHKSIYMVKKEK